MRGIRGAITVGENKKEEIWQAAKMMLSQILRRNKVKPEDIGACIFSTTSDITAGFPSTGARQMEGFDKVPLFDTRVPDIDDSMERCIRVLLLVDSPLKQSEIQHVYMGKAQELRPDLRNF